jgi:hypothetical protein
MAAAIFAGAATYSVIQRSNTDNEICQSVDQLRNDLVEVVRGGEERSKKAISDAFDGAQEARLLKNLEEQTDSTLSKIDRPDCP